MPLILQANFKADWVLKAQKSQLHTLVAPTFVWLKHSSARVAIFKVRASDFSPIVSFWLKT